MVTRVFAMAILLVGFVPVANAVPPEGTRESPEVEDVAGDVTYDATYTGSRDRPWLDLHRFWISYDPMSDVVDFTIEVADLEAVQSASYDFISWEVSLTGSVGEERGEALWLRVQFDSGKDPVCWCRWIVANDRFETVSATLRLEFERPGFVHIVVPREELAKRVTKFTGQHLDLDESYELAPNLQYMPVGSDDAGSSAEFDVAGLRRASTGESEETFEATASSSAGPRTSDARTATIGLGALVLSLMAVAFIRRRP